MKRPRSFEEALPDALFITVPTVSPGDEQDGDGDDGFPCVDDLFELLGQMEVVIESWGEEPSDERLVEAQRVLADALAALTALTTGN